MTLIEKLNEKTEGTNVSFQPTPDPRDIAIFVNAPQIGWLSFEVEIWDDLEAKVLTPLGISLDDEDTGGSA